MFPHGNYSAFDERYFQDKYPYAYKKFADIINTDKASKREICLTCELCDKKFSRRYDFVEHCQEDKMHSTLFRKMQMVDPDEILN